VNSSALRDIWALVMQVEKLKISHVTIYHEILEGSYDFLIYNIFDKIIKKKKTWTSRFYGQANCSHVCLIWAAILITATKKQPLQTNTSFIQIESSVDRGKLQYRNPLLHSITFLCFRLWPIRNEIFAFIL